MTSSTSSLRALLFDFDGVLADTEPIHLKMFQEVLKGEGILLTESDYNEKYLGLDDRGCFEQVYKDQDKTLSSEKKVELIHAKNKRMLEFVRGASVLLPGVREFLESVNQKYYLAIVSGALRNDIESILEGAGLRNKFSVLVAAEDVSIGKPNSEGYRMAIRLLNRDFVPASEILLPQECLVIEDSPWGIEAAHGAGAKCLALLTSYPKDRLTDADLIAPNLRALKWGEVIKLFPVLY